MTVPITTMLDRSGGLSITWTRVGGTDIGKDRIDSSENKGGSGLLEELRRSAAAEGDRVFLRVMSTRGVRHFGVLGKLSPHYVGPF